ncbi:Uncharacterised protein [Mycobacteroides abscessus subsp. abscessus]|nr:Uncharacterised protein [Mycobacteroides abscessus subsp. abscessus]
MSTTTSYTEPVRQVTYLAWPGGTSAKWIPRSDPAADTEQLACCSSNGCPMASASAGPLNNSRKTPRLS